MASRTLLSPGSVLAIPNFGLFARQRLSTTAGQEPPGASLSFATTSLQLTAVPRRPADGFHGVLFIHDLGEPEVTWGDTGRGEALPGTPLVPANGSQGPQDVLGGATRLGTPWAPAPAVAAWQTHRFSGEHRGKGLRRAGSPASGRGGRLRFHANTTERERKQGCRKGRGQMDLGEVAGARRTRLRGTAPALSLGPPLCPAKTSSGRFSGAEEGHFPCQVSIFKPSVAMETPFPADPCRGAAVTFPQRPSRSIPSSDLGQGGVRMARGGGHGDVTDTGTLPTRPPGSA